jgi:endonuclease YncB( thermonuclease family)
MTGPKKLVSALFSALAFTGCAAPSGRAVPVARARSSAPVQAPARIAPPPAVRATVAYIVDGDTIIVLAGTGTAVRAGPRSPRRVRGVQQARRVRRVRVRLLGLDAPEDTRRHGCFGGPATAALRRLLPEGAAILLAVDRRRADPYGRALGYVWRADGLFVNRVLLRRGYATTLSLPPAGPYRAEFAAAEALARAGRAGLWRACRRPPRPEGPARRRT